MGATADAAEPVAQHHPTVWLTFDDGPNPPFTLDIADVLEARGFSGTFFQVGRAVQRFPEVVAELAQRGHVIGNHSWSHSWPKCWSRSVMSVEIDRTQELIADVAGYRPTLYRPPWLLPTPGLGATLASRGLSVVGGTFAHDWEVIQPAATIMAHQALRRVRPGTILIFHDGFDGRGGPRRNTVDAVARVVDELSARGWACESLSAS